MIASSVLAAITALIFVFLFWIAIIRLSFTKKLNQNRIDLKSKKPIIAFFHPAADACGGGEKVLFNAILALQNKSKELNNPHIVVYSGSKLPKNDIFELVKNRFAI